MKNDENKVLVGNLATSIDEIQIMDLFSSTVGRVVSVDIPRNPKNAINRGYATVEMGSPDEAAAAVKLLDGHELGGRILSLTLAEAKKELGERKWYKFGAR